MCRLLWGIFSFILGCFWAATMAEIRLNDALPRSWEWVPIEIVGVVASVPELVERGERFRFDVETVVTADAVVPRHISLSSYRFGDESFIQTSEKVAQFHAGERWQLTVRLKRPHGTQNPHGFDFEAWALEENIRATGSIKNKAKLTRLQALVWRPQYVLESLRENIKRYIGSVLEHRPYAGIIQALVMGDDNQIMPEDWQVFLRTGTSHLMSISGLHITMLSGLVFGFVGFFWRRNAQRTLWLPTRKAATIAGVATALAYALIAGFSVPTQRTLYMLLVFALALWSGRQIVISQVLAVAACVVVAIDPWAVVSPGFWLSFSAVAIMAYAMGSRIGRMHWLHSALQTQWAVTVGMIPLLLLMFNQFSITSPVANAVAIPLISFVVTPLALLGSFLGWEAPLYGAYHALELCMSVLRNLDQLPISTWQQHAPETWTLLFAVLGVSWLLLPRGFPLRWFGLLGLLPMLLIRPDPPMPGEMRVTVLDVGQGLSVVVQTAQHVLLYDAGSKYSEKNDAGSRIVVPFLRGEGVHQLDGFIVSHDDMDHSGGMQAVLAQIPVDWMASSLPQPIAVMNSMETMRCYSGQAWRWDGVDFEIISPSLGSYSDGEIRDNNRSCVLKVTSPSGSLLLTGDIEKKVESQLLTTQSATLESDVLLVPHHGSKTSSGVDFIATVRPSLSVFTVGYLNRHKHPNAEVLARYQAMGSKIYRSDEHGALKLTFSHQQIRVESQRRRKQHYWHDDFTQSRVGSEAQQKLAEKQATS